MTTTHAVHTHHVTASDGGAEPRWTHPYRRSAALLLALGGLLSGCSIEGVCIEQRERDSVCRPRVSRFECQGEWHEYVPGDA